MSRFGADGLNQLKQLVMANSMAARAAAEDDIPDLIQNFDEVNVDEKVEFSAKEIVDWAPELSDQTSLFPNLFS